MVARILGNLWLLGLLLLAGGVALIALLGPRTLTCTKGTAGQGECTVADAALVRPTTHRFPVADLRGARAAFEKRDTYILEVRTADGSYSLRPRRTDERSIRRLAAEVDAFVRDPGPATLRVEGKLNLMPHLLGGVMIVLGVLTLAAAVKGAIGALRGRGSTPVRRPPVPRYEDWE